MIRKNALKLAWGTWSALCFFLPPSAFDSFRALPYVQPSAAFPVPSKLSLSRPWAHPAATYVDCGFFQRVGSVLTSDYVIVAPSRRHFNALQSTTTLMSQATYPP